jgi:hypothetical protein
MTRAELRAFIIQASNRSDKSSPINDLISMGLQEISRMHEWESMRTEADYTIAQGATSQALPANSRLVEARLIDGLLSLPLETRSKLWVVTKWPNISANPQGKPQVVYEENGYVYFYPLPSASYTVRMTTRLKSVVSLTNDSDTNPLVGTDYVLCCWVLAELYDSLEMFDKAQGWRSKFAFYMNNAVGADMRTMSKYTAGELKPDLNNASAYLDPFNNGRAQNG